MSSDDDGPVTKIDPGAEGRTQGLGSADAVVGGEEIHIDKDLSEKERKKLAAKEAKKKRDQMVGKMVKTTESGLGAFADMTEMFTKWVLHALDCAVSEGRG
jgi:hypothetical protein